MARITLEQAYPGVSFRWRSRNWWARLTRVPPECVHLERGGAWMATYIPDLLYLCGKPSVLRRPARPEVSLCRTCLLGQIERDASHYKGRVIAFEPDADAVSQYFFVGASEFDAAGLQEEVAAAISRRLGLPAGNCGLCDHPALWLWISRDEVSSLDEVGRIAMARGESLCAEHGAKRLCSSFAQMDEANLFYVNAPYGDSGAYVWI